MAWDPSEQALVLFGGLNSLDKEENDTWLFSGGTWSNVTTTGPAPSPRALAQMAYDPVDGYLLLFGGSGSTTPYLYNDTWAFENGTWKNLTANVTGAPSGTYNGMMAWDNAGNDVVLFGGVARRVFDSTNWTYTYRNGSWTNHSGGGRPLARCDGSFVYDAAVNADVLFGGQYGCGTTHPGIYSDTWTYSNGSWNDVTPTAGTGLGDRTEAGLAYDDRYDYVALFGGAINKYNAAYEVGDTWVYGRPLIGQLTISPNETDLGDRIVFNATPLVYSGYVNLTYFGLPPGCSGGNLSVISCLPSGAGAFNVSVRTNDSSGVSVNYTTKLLINEDPAVSSLVSSETDVSLGTSTWLNATVAAGTPPFTYNWTGLPRGCPTANTTELQCVPYDVGNGSYPIRLLATDRVGMTASATITITVVPHPTIIAFAAVSPMIDLGQPLNLTVRVAGGAPPLQFEYYGLPKGCATHDSPELNCTPISTGKFTIIVNGTDDDGITISGTAEVQVNPDPTVVEFNITSGVTEVGLPVQVVVQVSGGTGPFSFAYTDLPAGCNLIASAGGSCDPTSPGLYVVGVTATDSRGMVAAANSTLSISPGLALTSAALSRSEADAGQNVSLELAVTGGIPPIFYNYTGLPTNCDGTNSPTVSCQVLPPGVFTIVATAMDWAGVSAESAVRLSVYPDPTVTQFTVDPSSVLIGENATFGATATGGVGPYDYRFVGLPPGCASQDVATLPCAPSQTGAFNVSVDVTDAAGYVTSSEVELSVQASSGGSPFAPILISGGYSPLLIALGASLAIGLPVALTILANRRRKRATPRSPEEVAGDPRPVDGTP